MAIVIGLVTIEEHRKIRASGYELAGWKDIDDFYSGRRPVLPEGDHSIAVWVDCDVTDLLVLEKEPASPKERDEALPYQYSQGRSKLFKTQEEK